MCSTLEYASSRLMSRCPNTYSEASSSDAMPNASSVSLGKPPPSVAAATW